MKVEHFHNGWYLGDTGFKDTNYTPESVQSSFDNRIYDWYDVMWGSVYYKVKNINYADNRTKIIVKLTRVF